MRGENEFVTDTRYQVALSAARRRQGRAESRHKTLTCRRCGAAFTAVRQTALYCSSTCRQPLSPLAADRLVRHYFKHRDPLPRTLGELLRAAGLTSADATLLCKTYGAYYFVTRYAQAWPKALPLGQQSPAAASMWNNLGRAFRRSLNLKKVK